MALPMKKGISEMELDQLPYRASHQEFPGSETVSGLVLHPLSTVFSHTCHPFAIHLAYTTPYWIALLRIIFPSLAILFLQLVPALCHQIDAEETASATFIQMATIVVMMDIAGGSLVLVATNQSFREDFQTAPS